MAARSHWAKLAKYCAVVVWLASSLSAQSQIVSNWGGVISTYGKGNDKLDIHYLLECSGADGYGYVHFRVFSPGASSRDRTLDLRLYRSTDEGDKIHGIAFSKSIVLAEGASSVEAELPIFLHGSSDDGSRQGYSRWDVGVFEDGKDLELSRALMTGLGGGYVPQMLAPGERPDYVLQQRQRMQTTTLQLIGQGQSPSLADALLLQAIQQNISASAAGVTFVSTDARYDLWRDPSGLAAHRHVHSAPLDWKYYLQFRLVQLDATTLEQLTTTNLRLAQALKVYVAAGGNLVVTGVPGQRCQRLIDAWLGQTDAATWTPIHRSPAVFDSRSVVPGGGVMAEPSFMAEQAGMEAATMASSGLVPWANVPGQPVEPSTSDLTKALLAQLKQLPEPPTQPTARPLTLSGVLHDGLLMAELSWRIKSTQHDWLRQQAWQVLTDSESIAGGLEGFATDGRSRGADYSLANPRAQSVDETAAGKLAVDWSTILAADMPRLPLPILSFDWLWLPDHVRNWARKFIEDVQHGESSGVAVRSHVLGRILALDAPLSGVSLEVLQRANQQLTPSIGITTSHLQDGTWNLRNMIESVGRPPIWMFCTIVILFGLALGPGLLLLTGWIGRRSLMILLVPTLSLVTTSLVVLYAVLHEGFDTTVRTTSVVVLDQRSGDGFAWSRQTYFAGWPPREGQAFPNDVYFRPVSDNNMLPGHYGGAPDPRHPRDSVQTTVQVGESETIVRGELRARQQTQFLIGHPLSAQSPIQVTQVDRRSLTVANVGAHELPFVVVRDGEEGYYLAQPVPAGQSVLLRRQNFGEISGTLSRLQADHWPKLPESIRNLWWGNKSSLSSDILDISWQAYLSEQQDESMLPPFSFVTLQPVIPEVFMPIKGRVVESQVLTIGRLKW